MKRAIIIAAALLGGCAGRQEPQIVRVPVPVRCVQAADIPAPVPPLGTLPADARNAADLLAATLREVRNVERELRAMLIACST